MAHGDTRRRPAIGKQSPRRELDLRYDAEVAPGLVDRAAVRMTVAWRWLLAGGALFACSCASGADRGPRLVESRLLGRVDPSQPVPLDTLAPLPASPEALPPGIVASSRGGLALKLELAAGAPLELMLHDLRYHDGGGPCYAVHGSDAGVATPELGVIRVGRDGRFLAVPVHVGTSCRVALAELRAGVFHEVASTDALWPYVDWPALGPDGRLAFWAFEGAPGGSSATVVERHGAKLVVVLRVAPGLYKHWPSFTADGRLVVRVLVDESGGTERLVVDGLASRDYAGTGIPRCSPAGAHVAAAVRRDGQEHLWVDGQEVGPFDQVGNPCFLAEDLVGVVARFGSEVRWLVLRVSGGSSPSGAR